MYDVIVIGGGPAGLSAAIYASRGGMRTLVTEKLAVGGQAALTYAVENYPGFDDAPSGAELARRMHSHAEKCGAEFTTETVKAIENPGGDIKTVVTRKNRYDTKTVIFATGARPKKLGIEGEERFKGVGMSYCATCDGAFFRGKDAVVVGGGNTAFEDALYLAGICSNVAVIHRSDKFRAEKTLKDRVFSDSRIIVVTDSVVEEIMGGASVERIRIRNTKTGEKTVIAASAVFAAIGVEPESELAAMVVGTDSGGFIKTDSQMCTDVRGIFAAGDVRDTQLRQIVTAAADGALAAVSAAKYANNLLL